MADSFGSMAGAPFGTLGPQEQAEVPPTFLDNFFKHLVNETATLPRRAIEGAAQYEPGTNDVQGVRAAIEPAMETALTMTGGAGIVPAEANSLRAGIKAYHGSPHDFDRFDLSKIGTGEGAQVYGHGLYFADKEATAATYRDYLSKKQMPVERMIVGDRAIERGTPEFHAASLLADNNFTKADFNRLAKQWMEDAKGGNSAFLGANDTAQKAGMSAPEYFQRLHDFGSQITRKDVKREYAKGKMYEADLGHDADKFLGFDKMLSQQTPEMRDRVVPLIKPHADAYAQLQADLKRIDEGGGPITPAQAVLLNKPPIRPENYTGDQVYRSLTDSMVGGPRLTQKQASEALLDRGVPGLRYLDQGSRQIGRGSSNTVMFTDKPISIIRKYAVPGMVGAGGFGALGYPTEQQ